MVMITRSNFYALPHLLNTPFVVDSPMQACVCVKADRCMSPCRSSKNVRTPTPSDPHKIFCPASLGWWLQTLLSHLVTAVFLTHRPQTLLPPAGHSMHDCLSCQPCHGLIRSLCASHSNDIPDEVRVAQG